MAGTAPVPPGDGPPPAGPYDQARLCLDLIGEALGRAGTSLEHVVRTGMYLTDAAYCARSPARTVRSSPPSVPPPPP